MDAGNLAPLRILIFRMSLVGVDRALKPKPNPHDFAIYVEGACAKA